MRAQDLLTSLAIHSAALGAAGLLYFPPSAPERGPETIPIFFEIVEASMPAAAGSALDPAPETAEEAADEPRMEQDEPIAAEEVTEEDPAGETGLELQKRQPTEDEPEEVDAANREEPPAIEGNTEESQPEGEKEPAMNDEERAKVSSAPVALNRIVPVYPRPARRKGHEGCTTVEVTVTEDGAVGSAEVIVSSGFAELDAAALAAVRSARFAPATEDGRGTVGRLRLTFDFRLK